MFIVLSADELMKVALCEWILRNNEFENKLLDLAKVSIANFKDNNNETVYSLIEESIDLLTNSEEGRIRSAATFLSHHRAMLKRGIVNFCFFMTQESCMGIIGACCRHS